MASPLGQDDTCGKRRQHPHVIQTQRNGGLVSGGPPGETSAGPASPQRHFSRGKAHPLESADQGSLRRIGRGIRLRGRRAPAPTAARLCERGRGRGVRGRLTPADPLLLVVVPVPPLAVEPLEPAALGPRPPALPFILRPHAVQGVRRERSQGNCCAVSRLLRPGRRRGTRLSCESTGTSGTPRRHSLPAQLAHKTHSRSRSDAVSRPSTLRPSNAETPTVASRHPQPHDATSMPTAKHSSPNPDPLPTHSRPTPDPRPTCRNLLPAPGHDTLSGQDS